MSPPGRSSAAKVAHGEEGCLRPVRDAELGEHRAHMRLDGLL
jgi:hypothetical protein